jgi:hypothetical protein
VLQLKNETPFKATIGKFPNQAGVETLYLVVTATFEIEPQLALAQEQLPIVMGDEYFGLPGESSLRYAGELHLGKPGTDVVVQGFARAPAGKPVSELQVGVRVGGRDKMLLVTGDREWLGLEPSKPLPFRELPLRYERAFGGVLRERERVLETEERNPLGVGLGISLGQGKPGDPLPNIEAPGSRLRERQRCVPAGLGCIPPAWQPRRSLAGTYDEQWQRTRAPYVPEDFQLRYFSCAPAGLLFEPCLRGREPIVLVGMSERGPIYSALPTCVLDAGFLLHGDRHGAPCLLQTVVIEPDDNRLRLTFHAQHVCDKQALEYERIEVKLSKLDLSVPRVI